MKKNLCFLLILLLSFLSFQSHSQTFGLKGGINLANMLEKDDLDTYSDEYKMNIGFHIGAFLEYPLTTMLYFEPGLFYNTKGFQMDVVEMDVEVNTKAVLHYLDVPLTLKAMTEIDNGVELYGLIGPYLGVGLSGKIKGEASEGGYDISVDEDIEWGSDEDDHLKRLDYGLTFGAGVEISDFLIGVSYDLGLANLSVYTENGTTSSHRVIKFSIGYKIGN